MELEIGPGVALEHMQGRFSTAGSIPMLHEALEAGVMCSVLSEGCAGCTGCES